jgi:hypothetical protein
MRWVPGRPTTRRAAAAVSRNSGQNKHSNSGGNCGSCRSIRNGTGRDALLSELGRLIKAAIGGDSKTGCIGQPFRVAGSPHFISQKKIDAGLDPMSVPTFIVKHTDKLWTREQIREAFKAVAADIVWRLPLTQTGPRQGAMSTFRNPACPQSAPWRSLQDTIGCFQRKHIHIRLGKYQDNVSLYFAARGGITQW